MIGNETKSLLIRLFEKDGKICYILASGCVSTEPLITMGMLRTTAITNVFHRLDLEAWIWIVGLLYLAFIEPAHDSHFSFCLFRNLGLSFCPGCGIGRSISFLLHGQIRESLQAHVLGIVALPILLHRIFVLLKHRITMPYLLTH